MELGSGLVTPTEVAGVLDAEGYAICPDCGMRVNCGSVGLPNLDKRHRGTKVCLKRQATQAQAGKGKKNASIMSFLRPKPVPVPSTVTAPALVGGAGASLLSEPAREAEEILLAPSHASPSSKPDEVPILQMLRVLVSRIPDTVPEATHDDALAVFGGDPASFIDPEPEMDGDDIWQGMMNATLKRVFGWQTEVDLTTVIKRGPLGMDGFVRFIEYYIVDRGVPAALLEGKLEHLLDTLEKMAGVEHSPVPPSSGPTRDVATSIVEGFTAQPNEALAPAAPLVQVPLDSGPLDIEPIDVDAIPDPEPAMTKKISLKSCVGYVLPIPDGQSPHSSYPFALHDHRNLPWDYSVANCIMTLRARACEKKPGEGGGSCQPCQNLSRNAIVEGIIKRMRDGVPENANYPFHGFSNIVQVLQKTSQNEYLRFRALNQARKIIVQAGALSDHKRFAVAIASGKFERVDRLMSIALRQRRGIRGILTLYDAAAKGIYKPKNYTEEDDMRGLLLWRLGGNRIAHIAHRALGLPSLTTLRNRSIMPHIIPSPSRPVINEIQRNVEATFESVKEFLDGQEVVHQVLMLDEIATEKRVRWDHKTNMFLGVCREHGHNTSLEFTTKEDMEELFRCLDEGEVHAAAEVSVA
ncbi:hypothetical protein LshimejAT787_1501910 [Lyophyllum shimeji]|uniref:Uncharacterized protein n=1 Tax=Lyophyllum shimeji TaxID=47721 RepID=A0A9P3UTA5_LYOSH|nr:hypothetical protein LshimejAT787_1501910 [Lyophyllum shimeji]